MVIRRGLAVRLRASAGIAIILAGAIPFGTLRAGQTTYQYDALGRVRSVTYPDGAAVTYAYDPAGNRTQVVSSGSTNTPSSTPFGPLHEGDSVVSLNGLYELVMQWDGNLVLYEVGGGAIWSSETWESDADVAMVDTDGNFVLKAAGVVLKAITTTGVAGSTLALTNDGNILLVSPAGATLWSANSGSGLTLAIGQEITSPDGQTHLRMLANGSLAAFNASNVQIWSSGTAGSGATVAQFQANGNLVLLSGSNVVWQTWTDGHPGAHFFVDNDSNVVITTADWDALWYSNTGRLKILGLGTSLFSPDGQYHITMQHDGNVVLYGPSGGIWGTDTWGSGAEKLIFQNDGNLVLVGPNGAIWSTETWENYGATMSVTNAGALEIKSETGQTLWASNAQSDNYLTNGQSLSSPSGRYTLNMGGDGNVVLVDTLNGPIWDTATYVTWANKVKFIDGELKVLNGSTVVWSSGSGGNPGATIEISDSGNLIIRNSSGGVIWSAIAIPSVQTINVTATSNLRSLANAAGYTGSTTASYEFIVPSDTTILGAAGGGTAIDTGTWPTGVTLSLIVNGNVYGGGGNGGKGYVYGGGYVPDGGSGGDAVNIQAPISITVNSGGAIKAGGGGGGGGGGSVFHAATGGGGGGGGGFPNGAGGLGAVGNASTGSAGSSGTTSGGGAGGSGSGNGGDGGNSTGYGGKGTQDGLNGGFAGYAIRKNANTVTITNNGTIAGTQN